MIKRDTILRVGAKLLLPYILLFALYVHFHGDYGPGGGFQAGVISAGTIILYAIAFGLEAAKRVAPPAIVERVIPLGVLLYAGTGLAGIMLGRNYLDYTVLGPDFAHAHEWGILLVETGVLLTVSSTMLSIFYAFAERGRQ